MLIAAAIIGILLLLGLSAAGPFVESINPDELNSMGVVRRH